MLRFTELRQFASVQEEVAVLPNASFEILAIEDDSADLFWLKRTLRQTNLNHRLSVAIDGAQAVDFLRKRGEFTQAPTPDLIFLDVHLPVLNGLEVLRQIPGALNLPVCVLSSSVAEREMFQREFNVPSTMYLQKPITRQKLLDCLRSHPQLKKIADRIEASPSPKEPSND